MSSRSRTADGWRFAVGTLTAWSVRAPSRIDRDVVGLGLVLAPLAVLPLGVAVAALLWAGREAGLAPVGVAAAAVGALALGSRALHLDGLADTADGLTASYDRERALAVMRTGDVGPAGVVAIVVVLAVQVGALASLVGTTHGWWLAGTAVVASRATVAVVCTAGIPAARPEGLGATVAGSVPRPVAVALVVAAASVLGAAAAAAGLDWWRGPVALVAAVAAVAVLVRRCVRRIGGISGDVLGAGIEVGLAVLLLALT
ncbi:cobalamin-5-phosphate synthase [Aeromicrobium marinum DSM 15272]|uniref:Adenosylcobinamide-GDP ribazoletransferase n=1 Tax=Aeromicrobium marinum DSM 15272 TaxID=585531 RepID=E2SC08_9ACTN|nr:adenosylcobinamide-GDP ribazoletransferase [Aeromicrobium marinum]EFQ83294.1 cobalamin-5-phosphate synthase [Aeromicrobium marinum DSM 15272]